MDAVEILQERILSKRVNGMVRLRDEIVELVSDLISKHYLNPYQPFVEELARELELRLSFRSDAVFQWAWENFDNQTRFTVIQFGIPCLSVTIDLTSLVVVTTIIKKKTLMRC